MTGDAKSSVIIGADGAMGFWFTRHLGGLGYTVHPADLRGGSRRGVSELRRADLVVVSVPIKQTPIVVEEASMLMKKGAALVEVASLKTGVNGSLKAASLRGITTLSVHPMFGPLTDSLRGKTVALVPVLCIEEERRRFGEVFPDVEPLVLGAEDHDRYMAMVLGLPYLVNLAFLRSLEDVRMLERVGGSTFMVQLALALSVLKEEPELIDCLLGDDYLEAYARRMTESISELTASRDGDLRETRERLLDLFKDSGLLPVAEECRQASYEAVVGILGRAE